MEVDSTPGSSSYEHSAPASSETDTNNNIRSGLSLLPRNLLGLVAYHLVVDDHGIGRDPSALLPLLLTSRSIYSALQFDEYPQLYYDLYCATFDHAALQRRFNWMAKTMAGATSASRPPPPPGGPGGPGVSVQGGTGGVGGGGGGRGGGTVYPNPSPASAGGGDGPPKGKKMFKLFDDPRSWAIDYKTRWEMARRMKKVVRHGRLYIPGVCDKEAVLGDLWNVWFLLTENDGKNVQFLAHSCDYQSWGYVYYKDDILQDSLLPGYPRDTGDKSLGLWCSLLSGTDNNIERSHAEVDEKIFLLRPYVFACAKYDITYAPWHHRRLPLGGTSSPVTPSTANSAGSVGGVDIENRSKAVPYKRFGYTWRRAPPLFVLGAYLIFLRLLERHPDRMSLSANSSNFATPALPGNTAGGLFSVTRILPSIYHDREWQRNSVCQDPYTSPGLPAMTFYRELQGFWRGKFLIYDFELYRQILAGDMRGLYTGQFAEQVAEMELHETVIRIKKDEVGGAGPLLAAGFRDMEFDQGEVEQERIRCGYGYQVVGDVDEVDEPGWTKEILISGRCRTEWGWAWVRGRVRAWDGLVILALTYQRHAMNKWLWRGYLHTGGHMIGRWRDSFTDEHLRGYEGAFGMIRSGDIFWPPHFPGRMEDSMGMQAQAQGQGQGQGGNGQTAAQTSQQASIQITPSSSGSALP